MKRTAVAFLLLVFVAVSCSDEGNVKKDYWENGNLKSELSYEDGELNGRCVWYMANGKPQMEAMYKHNKMHGLARRWYENGNLMEEMWYKEGARDSVYRSFSLKGQLTEEMYYENGKLNGEYRRWYENGQVFQEGQFADDMMDGSWLVFYADGNLASKADFVKGTGTQTSYDVSGYICLVTAFVDNEKHGREIYYNPDGKVSRVAVYENGEWVGDEDLKVK